MTDTAQLEMRLNRASDKISRLKGDVNSLKDTVKKLEIQLNAYIEAEYQRRLANYGLKK
jgi:hypothetical protein